MYFVDFTHDSGVLETISCSDVNEPMWLHAGFDILDYQGHDPFDMIPALDTAIKTLRQSPDHYQLYEEGYGGNLGTVLEFLGDLKEAVIDYRELDMAIEVRY